MRAKQKPSKADTENAAQFDAIAIFFNAIAICTETGVNGACHNGKAVPHVVIMIYLMTNIIRHGNVHHIAGIALL